MAGRAMGTIGSAMAARVIAAEFGDAGVTPAATSGYVQGSPAHTLSSFNLHTDYHRSSDDVEGVDFEHLVAAVETVIMAVRALADAPSPPAWNEGGQPDRIAR